MPASLLCGKSKESGGAIAGCWEKAFLEKEKGGSWTHSVCLLVNTRIKLVAFTTIILVGKRLQNGFSTSIIVVKGPV